MVSVAVQTDVSSVVCGEFVIEQREALSNKQTETEFSVRTEHCSSDPAVADARCNTIKSNQPGQESTFIANKLQILALR